MTLFIEASVLAQGLLDAESTGGDDADEESTGGDDAGPGSRAWLALPQALARVMSQPWDGRTAPTPAALALLESIEQGELPARVTPKEPEAYAHFALYPELYLEAARASRLPVSKRAVGVRSIGTGLACIVAAGLGTSTPPITARPVGPPFERQLRSGPLLTHELEAMAHADAVAIVDEGPGLSGSSFGAVADVLEARGACPASGSTSSPATQALQAPWPLSITGHVGHGSTAMQALQAPWPLSITGHVGHGSTATPRASTSVPRDSRPGWRTSPAPPSCRWRTSVREHGVTMPSRIHETGRRSTPSRSAASTC
ncbi:hypothetical protein [Corallococcus sp. 4LFB]|uniref:hypothetical protein n=1 Tax=Corallococcus sp. 4LFB TaxID=3383249 RepID=UPI0039762C3C